MRGESRAGSCYRNTVEHICNCITYKVQYAIVYGAYRVLLHRRSMSKDMETFLNILFFFLYNFLQNVHLLNTITSCQLCQVPQQSVFSVSWLQQFPLSRKHEFLHVLYPLIRYCMCCENDLWVRVGQKTLLCLMRRLNQAAHSCIR